ncbi:hypothetical protein [Vibrio mediterranei]|uniref:hypothetical protein n=1 Tax=Vibrio mediterranei TaxID=689 RepID=UPI00228393FB|nr:hypothetical protein [Vibrio mediterranei]MCY9855313.1 hypothetical protein [Vibrio mediterranei]
MASRKADNFELPKYMKWLDELNSFAQARYEYSGELVDQFGFYPIANLEINFRAAAKALAREKMLDRELDDVVQVFTVFARKWSINHVMGAIADYAISKRVYKFPHQLSWEQVTANMGAKGHSGVYIPEYAVLIEQKAARMAQAFKEKALATCTL